MDTVVFDIGNVLIDWNPRYLYRKVFGDEEEMESFLREVATLEWHLEQDRGRTTAEATEVLAGRHPEWREEIEAFYSRWDEMFGGSIEGSVSLLHELDGRGYALYALTNWSSELFGRTREEYRFLEVFREILVSGEVGLIKPDPAIYELLIERTGLDPSRTLFIDDSRANVEAARGLGFTGVLFTGPEALRERLAGHGLVDAGEDGA